MWDIAPGRIVILRGGFGTCLKHSTVYLLGLNPCDRVLNTSPIGILLNKGIRDKTHRVNAITASMPTNTASLMLDPKR